MNILITGGTGMIGSAFKKINSDHDLTLIGSKQCNLLEKKEVEKLLNENNFDAVIHLAAKVGGVKSNSDYVYDYFYENMLMNTNILNEALKARIPKFLSLLSTCIYPDNPVYPLTEEQIHNGKPHKSNYGYAYAKRMIEVQTRAIRQQYGLKYITAIPNNIYGENDNFDLDNSHVIPAIIRKIHESKLNNTVPKFWGDGSPIREFTYSVDIARALLWMIEHYDDEKPLNIGSINQYSISDIVEIIKSLMGVEDMNVAWDSSLPSGQYKKPSCNKKFLEINPNFEYTDIKLGLQKTIDWYNKTYPKVRGV